MGASPEAARRGRAARPRGVGRRESWPSAGHVAPPSLRASGGLSLPGAGGLWVCAGLQRRMEGEGGSCERTAWVRAKLIVFTYLEEELGEREAAPTGRSRESRAPSGPHVGAGAVATSCCPPGAEVGRPRRSPPARSCRLPWVSPLAYSTPHPQGRSTLAVSLEPGRCAPAPRAARALAAPPVGASIPPASQARCPPRLRPRVLACSALGPPVCARSRGGGSRWRRGREAGPWSGPGAFLRGFWPSCRSSVPVGFSSSWVPPG